MPHKGERDISVVYDSNYVDVDVKKVGCSSSHDITGKRGKTGAKGEPGEKGEQGERGEKGEKGEIGETGEKGEQGEKGDTGPQGMFGGVVADDILPYKNSVISIGNPIMNFKRLHCESVFLSGPTLFIQEVPIEVKNRTINLPAGTTLNNKIIGQKGDTGDKGDTGERGADGPPGEKGDPFTFVVSITNNDLSNNYYILPTVDSVHIYTIDDSFNYTKNTLESKNNILTKNYVKLLANHTEENPDEIILFKEDVSTMIHTKSNGQYKIYN